MYVCVCVKEMHIAKTWPQHNLPSNYFEIFERALEEMVVAPKLAVTVNSKVQCWPQPFNVPLALMTMVLRTVKKVVLSIMVLISTMVQRPCMVLENLPGR